MKLRIGIIAALLIVIGNSCSKHQQEGPMADQQLDVASQLLPKPQKIEPRKGAFVLEKELSIVCSAPTFRLAKYLKAELENHWTGTASTTFDSSDVGSGTQKITLDLDIDVFKNEEAYKLAITPSFIQIKAAHQKGLMRGIQTIRQLLGPDFHTQQKQDVWRIQSVVIEDAPKFKHRGMLLDCCRHFFSKDVIKKYIDLLALYKMNTLHWHLTEDQGWRLAIDGYPELAEVAAWRTDSSGNAYGGFYTKEDVVEIVNYASERYIDVIPEIEMPGHSQAVLAAYPSLSCTGGPFEVANDWGVFKEIYCAGNDSTFVFLENVLSKVIEYFPSDYIHIGGDEAPKVRWENCPKCQKRMKDHGLKDEHELQSYFIKRVEKFLNTNGKKLIGWDEILQGGLSESATVQSWRGMEGGIAAAKSGNNVIMSPTSHAYFDYDVKSINLEKVYEFDPIPKDLTQEESTFIIGGECNLWSEHIPTEAILDRQAFPRLLAMSEVLWSYPKNRDYREFLPRVRKQYEVLENRNVKYGIECIPLTLTSKKNEVGKLEIRVNPNMEGLDWKILTSERQTLDSIDAMVVEDETMITVQGYLNHEPYGDHIIGKFAPNKILFVKGDYKYPCSEYYKSNGEVALTDGKLGSTDFRDGNWQGFWGNDAEIVFDLEAPTAIHSVAANFLQYNNAWIFMPTTMEAYSSMDGENWVSLGVAKSVVKPKQRYKIIERIKLDIEKNVSASFLKVRIRNLGKVPDWHEAAGSDAWIFVDEIIVK